MPIASDLVQLLLGFFYAHELVTLFIALLIEEAGVPIPLPGDTLLLLAGAEPRKTLWSAVTVIAVSSVAVFLGSTLLYEVMRRGGRPFLLKYGKYLLINQRRLGRVEGWFQRHGRTAIVIGRFIPGLRIPTTIVAGISGYPPRDWLVTAAIISPLWAAFYYVLGALAGREGPFVIAFVADLVDDIPKALLAASALLVLIGLALGAWRLRRRPHRRIRAET